MLKLKAKKKYSNIKRSPRIGDRFLCIKTVEMQGSGKIVYLEGKEYVSEHDGCITDENWNIEHWWTINHENPIEEFNSFFKIINK